MVTKKCIKCEEILPLTEEYFSKRKDSKDGFRNECNSCRKGPHFYHCNACGWEGIVNGQPRCLPCRAKKTAEWRENNPDKYKTLKRNMTLKTRKDKPWLEAQRKRIKRANNPEHYKAKYKERYNWLANGDVTNEELIEIYKRDNGKCVYCGKPVAPRFNAKDPRGFDHVIPRSKGGKHTKDNLVVCCGACNAVKSDKEDLLNV